MLAAFAILLLASAVAFAQEPDRTISDMVDELQRLQAKMAVGDKTAYPRQQERLRAIGAAIGAAKPEIFKQKSETDAIAVYLLSGGHPRDVAKALDRNDLPKPEEALLRGALGYAAGKSSDADALLEIDAKTQSLKLASQLAYAQSVLVTTRDSKRALALLDLARLLAPGGLIEEASLRRQILLVADLHDSDRVTLLARQYVERFGHSIYAENFVEGLAAAAVRQDLCDSVANLKKFSALLSQSQPEQRRYFLLSIARELTIAGHYAAAAAAAQEAASLSVAGSADENRAKLYDVASRFVQMERGAGMTILRGLDRAKLPRADQVLFDAAVYAAAHVYDPPASSAYAEAGREETIAAARTPGLLAKEVSGPVATVRRAHAAISVAGMIGANEKPAIEIPAKETSQ